MADPTTRPETTCSGGFAPVYLGDEPACPSQEYFATLPTHAVPADTMLHWSRHRVAVLAFGGTAAWQLQIVQTAHAVPVDRSGCTATSTAPAGTRPVPLPAGLASLSVCLYGGNGRLYAAGLLTGSDAAAAVQHERALHGVSDPSCDRARLSHARFVELRARYPSGQPRTVAVFTASCSEQGSRIFGAPLRAITSAAGMPYI